MTHSTESFQNELAKLRERFASDLAGKLEDIAAGWAAFQEAGNPEVLERLHRNVHSLAGSGGTFGYDSLSTKARSFEIRLKRFLQGQGETLPEDILNANELFQDLYQEIHRISPSPSSESSSRESAYENTVARPVIKENTRQQRVIPLITADNNFASQLASHLNPFGYTCTKVKDLDELDRLIQTGPVLAVFLDCDAFPGGIIGASMDGRHVIAGGPPLLLLSSRADMEARLEAPRHGAIGFFVKPVDFSRVLDRLESLDVQDDSEECRVLIVDDEELVAKRHELILQNHGLATRVLSDPMKILETLDEFPPDLILMDMYMPGCSGSEVAEVIRQKPDHLGLPILFLSGETEQTAQFLAVSRGGDDFLTKPIAPENLIRSVLDRIKRYRAVRSMMIRDGLTGLLNHTTMKQQIKLDLERACRHGGIVALAIMDLDHFKSINDTYGHPAGDVVLKNLSRFLVQRLRRSDVAGRVGGEEFAVLLHNVESQSAAWAVMDKLREEFSAVVHSGSWGEVRVTFSCGMAFYPDFVDENSLNTAADMALYEAKKAGRNTVKIMRENAHRPS